MVFLECYIVGRVPARLPIRSTGICPSYDMELTPRRSHKALVGRFGWCATVWRNGFGVELVMRTITVAVSPELI